MNIFESLLRKHHELDFAIRDRKGKVFYSDWDCDHPWVNSYLQGIDTRLTKESDIHLYKFYEDDEEIISKTSEFHSVREGLNYSSKSLLIGDGSTPLISSFLIWLYERGIKDLFYIPPLYYTFYYFAKLFGLNLHPISNRHPFEKGFQYNLPSKSCYLIVTDPIWYAGISLQENLISDLVKWQEKTESFIFVDGSFQYCNWNGRQKELTASFNSEQTIRLICPTKILAIHGFRFSYLLMPEWIRNDIRYIFANTHGSTTAHNIRFAKRAMSILDSDLSNSDLIAYIRDRYSFLIENGWLRSELSPDSGYFVFSEPTKKSLSYPQLSMGGDFFEQPRYKNYIRFNLLAPDMHKHIYSMME
uniref:Aspartate/methionine/tyrosine aminotransferase n=1 Tax=Candidatus Kentrum sp. TC TaxID=2126339 RepID=A0A450YAP1_9GAMM|nr:MAG: Aspartate/methionine/tyrosine aminotransferase [Candidatus Kentron sp. TC]